MSSWLEVAQGLPLGQKRRIQHECGDGKDMIVSHSADGYSAYCFRCGPVGFESHGYRTLEELAHTREANAAAQAVAVQSTELPHDFTYSIPAGDRNWLSVAGITVSRARACGIGYSNSLSRVVLPVHARDGTLRYWQARATKPWQKPKYINPQVSRETLLYWGLSLRTPEPTRTGGVVVTEDILSAIRVDGHMSSCSACGTKLSCSQSALIAEAAGDSPIFVWLDPDEAGRSGAEAMRRQLSLIHPDVRVLQSTADPKCLSDALIRDILNLPEQTNTRWRISK